MKFKDTTLNVLGNFFKMCFLTQDNGPSFLLLPKQFEPDNP